MSHPSARAGSQFMRQMPAQVHLCFFQIPHSLYCNYTEQTFVIVSGGQCIIWHDQQIEKKKTVYLVTMIYDFVPDQLLNIYPISHTKLWSICNRVLQYLPLVLHTRITASANNIEKSPPWQIDNSEIWTQLSLLESKYSNQSAMCPYKCWINLQN